MANSEDGIRSPFERHAQTVLQVLIAMFVAWQAYTVSEQSKNLVALQVEVRGLQTTMELMRVQTSDRYTAERAESDFGVRDMILDDIRERVLRLEHADDE